MNILVTGGYGYIGSHFIKDILKLGHKIVVVDDFSTGFLEALGGYDVDCQICDIRNKESLSLIFANNKFDIVYDFAAKLIAPESVVKPELYYDVNVLGLKNVLDCMLEYNVKKIVFSSTAAVHGLLDKKNELIVETDPTVPVNPYGESKLVGEKMIESYSKAYGIDYIIFRYFNVVGSVKYGEQLSNISSVVPSLINSINTGDSFKVFGHDYPTRDGSCIRDYIHIADLVCAHTLVCDHVCEENNGVYNLSIGMGTTVFELIKQTNDALNIDIKFELAQRREGDPVISAADNSKFTSKFPWDIKYCDIGEMVKETYTSWMKYNEEREIRITSSSK